MSDEETICGARTAYESSLSGGPFICDRPPGHRGYHQEHADLREGRRIWHTWENEAES